MMTSGVYRELVSCYVVRIVTGTKLMPHKELMGGWVSERFIKEENHQGLGDYARVWEAAVFLWPGTRVGTHRVTWDDHY